MNLLILKLFKHLAYFLNVMKISDRVLNTSTFSTQSQAHLCQLLTFSTEKPSEIQKKFSNRNLIKTMKC